jgi:hypothetical protein
MSEPCKVLFHPTLLASRAAEIARQQKAGLHNPARIEQDARGRPFIRAAEDPLAPALPEDPRRFGRLIRALRALAAWVPPTETPGRVYREGPG